MIKALIAWYLNALSSGGYPLVVLLMAMESSVLPLPSEFVIPPAAHLAHTEGRLSVIGIVVAGALGSWIGATVMYWAARLGGRPLLVRYGRYCLITDEKIRGAERWAARFGAVGIFMSRVLPVVRHLIGIPAGIVRLDYRVYSVYTLLGSAVWCSVLAWVGIVAGEDTRLMRGELHRVTAWGVGAAVVLGGLYYFLVHRFMRPGSGK
jgi:membrane protein DedA with SNARE-associated domain